MPSHIIAGIWRGKKLTAPVGVTTRPTSGRARQAAFDILSHAPWAGMDFMRAARVLDVFAGTGAYGLEALSRGAASATFIENGREALAALSANIAACKTDARIVRADATKLPQGTQHDLIFLDPPYGQNLVPTALTALAQTGWIAEDAIVAAEFGPQDLGPCIPLLAERTHGKARLRFWRFTP